MKRCRKGHAMTERNSYIALHKSIGKRYIHCRMCHNELAKLKYHTNKAYRDAVRARSKQQTMECRSINDQASSN